MWPLLFYLKDGFSGMSPGKRLSGLQVVDQATRNPIGFAQSFKPNLVLIIPAGTGFLVVVATMFKGRRWGDGWARTDVVLRKRAHHPVFDPRGRVCIKCGYDLTGNVSGICSECGQPTQMPPMATPIGRS